MVKQKAGLNREILSAGLGMAHQMLAYKAVEAGTRLHLSNTRQLNICPRIPLPSLSVCEANI
jgi:putative transposase